MIAAGRRLLILVEIHDTKCYNISKPDGRNENHGKAVFLLALSACLFVLLAACDSQAPIPDESRPVIETVSLTVWGAEEDEALLQQIFASFREHYAGQADFRITYQPQSESNCKDVLLGDLEGGADVFAFADDQVSALAAAGGLDPIADEAAVRNASLPAAVEAASVEKDRKSVV